MVEIWVIDILRPELIWKAVRQECRFLQLLDSRTIFLRLAIKLLEFYGFESVSLWSLSLWEVRAVPELQLTYLCWLEEVMFVMGISSSSLKIESANVHQGCSGNEGRQKYAAGSTTMHIAQLFSASTDEARGTGIWTAAPALGFCGICGVSLNLYFSRNSPVTNRLLRFHWRQDLEFNGQRFSKAWATNDVDWKPHVVQRNARCQLWFQL